ncbi:MAG: DUF1588 domain-containing protein [Pirellulaceae bacterium]
MARFFLLICWLLIWAQLSTLAVATAQEHKLESTVHEEQDQLNRGEERYQEICSRCHGDRGQGVEGEFERALDSDLELRELADLIADSMPPESPEICVGEDAEAVAAFVAKISGAKKAATTFEWMRLTNDQYRQSIVNLFGSGNSLESPSSETGLNTTIFQKREGRGQVQLDRKRIVAIDFDWGAEKPVPDLSDEDGFHVVWEGSFLAPETGTYGFQVESKNGYRLFVNDLVEPVIGNGISTVDEPVKAGEIVLAGGHWYSLRFEIQTVKKEQVAARVSWKPPHHEFGLFLPEQSSTELVKRKFVPQTYFPADDRSVGFARGCLITPEWDAATTDAALEMSQAVADSLNRFVKPNEDSSKHRSDCVAFCQSIAKRAFRRELSPDESQMYVEAFFENDESIQESVKGSLTAVLKSPWFLYPGIEFQKDRFQCISQDLAFAMWDSLPSEDLLDAVRKAQSLRDDELLPIIKQVVEHPLTRAKVRAFFVYWLALEDAQGLSKDPEVFQGFGPQIANDYQDSLLKFVEDTFWSEASDYRQLLLSDSLWVSNQMEQFWAEVDHEDVGESSDTESRWELRTEQAGRVGILTHPMLLAQRAYRRNTSPIHRGVFVSRSLLGVALKPPPVAVEPLGEDFDRDMTTRQRVEFQTRPENCMSCHQVINPLGFALEGFDAVGRSRESDNGKPVDASVSIDISDEERVSINGPKELARYVVESHDAHRHFVKSLFQYMVKQPIEGYGDNTLDRLTTRFQQSDFNMRQLVEEIALVVAMRHLANTQN